MRAQVIGSIAAHVVVGALLLLVHTEGAPSTHGHDHHAIELVDITPPSPPRATATPAAPGGGNAPPVLRAAATPRARRTSAIRAASRAMRTDVDPRGAITFDRGAPSTEPEHGDGDSDDSALGGTGSGGGRGDGRGLGLGAGGSRVAPPPPPPPPARGAPPPSKARPAKLIYPKRERGVEDGETFIARVTVDDEGYVVGARLVRGFGGRRDDEAAGLIFKFRYAPALDDAGKPIRSTLDQNFLVE